MLPKPNKHIDSKTLTLDQHTLAYDHSAGNGVGPCVIFCAGFNSNKQGNKAMALEAFCQQQGWEFVRFDYFAHGDSSGDFGDGTPSIWRSNVLAVIDRIAVSKEVILVGSSMGGWMALLAALARPDRVVGLLLIACAVDMTRYYTQRITGLPLYTDPEGRAYYSVENQYDDRQPYRIYQALIEDGERWFLLDQPIHFGAPVRLIHGVEDDVIEWQRSTQVMQKLTSEDVTLSLQKNGDHRLSTAADLRLIESTLLELVRAH